MRTRHPSSPRRWTAGALSAAAALGAVALAAGASQAATGEGSRSSCFLSNNWQGWTAPGDSNVLLLRVRINEIYRVELTPGTRVYKNAGYFLVNRIRGSNWICSPLDLDLTLSDHLGYQQPLIPVSLRKLTPEEVAAIPRKDLP